MSLLDRYGDALKVINSAITHRTDKVKLLLRKSEVETLIRTTPGIPPKSVGASYRTLMILIMIVQVHLRLLLSI